MADGRHFEKKPLNRHISATVRQILMTFGIVTHIGPYDTIRYDTRCYFNVRSKADISQLNLPHGTDN